jgi:hypothetical protein
VRAQQRELALGARLAHRADQRELQLREAVNGRIGAARSATQGECS